MKKALVLIILFAMFGWSIYNFAIKKNETSIENQQGENTSTGSNTEQGENIVYGLKKGNFAPDFEIDTINGETVKLSDYRGQIVFLNFWATWCPPCRAEMPDMQKIHEDYGDLDVALLGINQIETERSRDDVPKFLDEFEITFPILIDEDLIVGTRYLVITFPTTYVIDKEGKVYDIAKGPLTYDMMVKVIKDLQ